MSEPTILVCGEERHLCSCDDVAVKEVIYERTFMGMTKRFREMVCSECFSDEDYRYNKNIISINNLIINQNE